MDIYVDNFSVYSSGVLVLSSEKTITMKIEDTDFIFDFEDGEEGVPSIKIVESTEDRCHLTFSNFSSPLGTSIKDPILIASLDNGDSLYLQYAIITINKIIKVFQYTLYKSTQNGKQDKTR